MEERGMDDPANCPASQTNLRRCITSFLAASTLLTVILIGIKPAAAAPKDEVRATFDRFVAAQNSHDVKAVESLLRASPDFLWITRGTPVWGQEAALKRFGALYKGTWRLDPDVSGLKIMMLADDVAQIYVPITFSIGAPGQPAQQMSFLMNQILVRTPQGWQVSSILPIPLPAQ
jgi:ketosteroid isomerase-like protein